MTRRYFHPELPSDSDRVELTPDEATHAAAVMRVRGGDPMELFDGKGGRVTAVVSEVRRNRVWVDVDVSRRVQTPAGPELIVVTAIPTGDRGREMVTRMTEMGVTTLVPMVSSHSQRPPSDSAIQKLRRSVVEACKQCGRDRLMAIEPLRRFSDTLATRDFFNPILLHPDSDPVRFWEVHPPTASSLFVGPEGGFSEAEVQAAKDADWTIASLGDSIYRIETAVAAAVTLMVHARPVTDASGDS